MIVVDASALLEVLLKTPVAHAVENRILNSGQTLNAPHLIDVEVAQVLRRYTAGRIVDIALGREILSSFSEIAIVRHPHKIFLPRIWSLRNNLTAYDAAYVALAEALDAPLITHDQRLAKAPGHHAMVEVV